jgi:hypothetical protein
MLMVYLSVALRMKDFKAVLHSHKPSSNIFAELWSVSLCKQALLRQMKLIQRENNFILDLFISQIFRIGCLQHKKCFI